jgi:hypothetical protein
MKSLHFDANTIASIKNIQESALKVTESLNQIKDSNPELFKSIEESKTILEELRPLIKYLNELDLPLRK